MNEVKLDKEVNDYIKKLEKENDELKRLANNYKDLVINHYELKIHTAFFWDMVLLLTTHKIYKQ